MDPLTAAIVGAVVLFFVREIVTAIIFWVIFAIGGAIAAATDQAWVAGLGVFLAVIGALAWQVLAIVWIILDIVAIVQLASAGA